VHIAFNVLRGALVLGWLAFIVAYTHGRGHEPTTSALVLEVVVVARCVWHVRGLLVPEDGASTALSPFLAHRLACMLAVAIVPWVLTAGVLGADLSTRPALYEQIAQIIPVLLLVVVVEQRFFSLATGGVRHERFVLRAGFAVLVVGPGLGEIMALLAIASHVRWIEVVTTVVAASTIPSLLVLIAAPVLVGLYEPSAEPATTS
jgi:hypothetical protein